MWIEIVPHLDFAKTPGSLPARGVWIEISSFSKESVKDFVTPRKGSVD